MIESIKEYAEQALPCSARANLIRVVEVLE